MDTVKVLLPYFANWNTNLMILLIVQLFMKVKCSFCSCTLHVDISVQCTSQIHMPVFEENVKAGPEIHMHLINYRYFDHPFAI